MFITNLQITKSAIVNKDRNIVRNENSHSLQNDSLPVNKIQQSKQTIIQPKFSETNSLLIQTSNNGSSEDLKENSNLESKINNSKNKGNPIPENTRAFMESRFGADFSNVKIHTDSNSVQMNKELNAHAFTHGNDIYFNSGEFNPESSSGKHLLAHELTHVVQQNDKIQRKAIVYNYQDNEKNDMERAHEIAEKMSNKAQQYMGGGHSNHYKLWYDNNYNTADKATTDRYERVKYGWIKMYDVFKSKDIEYDCSKRYDTTFAARVHVKDKYYNIQIGNQFWKKLKLP